MQIIKVAVYEDNSGLREILSTIIRESEDFELVGEFGHCLDAVRNTEVFRPDVIIMDIDMPGRSGIEGVRDIKSKFPEVEIIMNTVFDDNDKIFQAIKAGATGYLLKKNSLVTFLQNIKDVKGGGAPMSPSIARRILNLQTEEKAGTPIQEMLSYRELNIIKLLSKGLSYKMVAEESGLSIDTVRTYIKRIYTKLHVHSVTEAINKIFIEKK